MGTCEALALLFAFVDSRQTWREVRINNKESRKVLTKFDAGVLTKQFYCM
jgi:hypothetical protein